MFSRIASLLLLIASVVSSTDNVGGPKAVVGVATSGHNLVDTLFVGIAISISLALFNMVPLVPLDGGKVLAAFFRTKGWHRLRAIYEASTLLMALCFFGFIIVKDFL